MGHGKAGWCLPPPALRALSHAHGEGGGRGAGGVSALKHAAVMTDLSGAKTLRNSNFPGKEKKKKEENVKGKMWLL